jgi:predicted metal-dependent hydrolase
MRDPQERFAHGVGLFNAGRFFECHEVLEEIWTPSRQPERWFLQSLIHFAVGFYHHQRGNALGACRQVRKGLKKIEPYLPEWAGVRTEPLAQEMRNALTIMEESGRVLRFPVIEQVAPYQPPPLLAGVARRAH